MSRTAVNLTIVSALAALALVGGNVHADESPSPTLTTQPAPAPANQPFHASFYYFGFPTAFGVLQDQIRFEGNTITVPFDSGCGWICPGTPLYHPYSFDLPALTPGTYQVKVVAPSPPPYTSQTYAVFSLKVGATSVPASGNLPLLALTWMLAVIGVSSARKQLVSRG